MSVLRGGLAAALIMFALPAATVATATLAATPAQAQTAASIGVEGNRRIEADTIRSYFKPSAGGRLTPTDIDDGLKALIQTGLFQDVQIQHRGGRLVVVVANLAPRQMKFGLSEGMVAAASGAGTEGVFLLSPDAGAKPGMRLH